MEEMKPKERSQMVDLSLFLLAAIIIMLLAIYVNGCTYSINMVHSNGRATDVIDETSTNSPSTSLKLPGNPIFQ